MVTTDSGKAVQLGRAVRQLEEGGTPDVAMGDLLSEGVFRRLLYALPNNTMRNGAGRILLSAAIEHGNGQAAVLVARHPALSDIVLKDIILLSVTRKLRVILTYMLQESSRVRRLFGDVFPLAELNSPRPQADDGEGSENDLEVKKQLIQMVFRTFPTESLRRPDFVFDVVMASDEEVFNKSCLRYVFTVLQGASLKQKKVRVAVARLWKVFGKCSEIVAALFARNTCDKSGHT